MVVIARSEATKESRLEAQGRLLRFARNDGCGTDGDERLRISQQGFKGPFFVSGGMSESERARSGGVPMSQEKTTTEVTIFGQTLKVRGDADAELTVKLAEFVDRKMQEAAPSAVNMTNILHSERIVRVAILAALNIAEELFHLQAEQETEKHLIEEKAASLLTLLDKELQPT